MQLKEALAAWERGAETEALDALVACWRSCHAPELAELARHWGRALRPAITPARTKAAFHTQWIETPVDLLHVGWLAETVDHLATPASMQARIARLAEARPDPRIADGVLAVVQRGKLAPLRTDDQIDPLYGPLVDLLVQQQDPRSVEPIRELIRAPRARLLKTQDALYIPLLRAIEALEGIAVEPVDAAAVRPFLPREEDLGELHDQLLDTPDDEGLLAVYADRLQQAGDPRGELIALQLGGTAAQARKARSLIKTHRTTWLGPLDEVFTKVEFRRGFPYSAKVRKRSASDHGVFRAAAADPRLKTLRILEAGTSWPHLYARLLASPHLRATQVDIPNVELVRAIKELREPRNTVETLVFRYLPEYPANAAHYLRRLFPNARARVDVLDRSGTGRVRRRACELLAEAGIELVEP